jgi:phage recombination protein Bet
MSNVATISQPRQSLIAAMAGQYQMDPKAFADTVRSTCLPKDASNEEFAAFLMVAKEYGLNPITREIYAFPKKGGGIQPIVGIDGWLNLINSNPQCDGMEFVDEKDAKGNLVSITCKIYRKDRNRPTEVTEYMAECKRPTEPWTKWPARMLRHKAAIQCARYAFGYAGIIDPEEAERSPEVLTGEVTAPPPPAAQIAPPPPAKAAEPEHTEADDMVSDAAEPFDYEAFLADLLVSLSTASDEAQLMELWDENDVEATLTDNEQALQDAFDMRKGILAKLTSDDDFGRDLQNHMDRDRE